MGTYPSPDLAHYKFDNLLWHESSVNNNVVLATIRPSVIFTCPKMYTIDYGIFQQEEQ